MEIRKSFVVPARPDTVWTFFTDPAWIAACLPGAELTGRVDDRTYTGQITVKVGPVVSSYRGKVVFERLDPKSHKAEITATGQDVRGKGGANMKISSTLTERTPGETEVSIVSEVSVTGFLAQMGRGMIQEVSDHMFQEFTSAMSASFKIADPTHQEAVRPTASEPIQVFSVAALASHPLTWVALLGLGFAAWWFIFGRQP
jgi:carbon monoxide dehydrogenase subunit G